MKINYNCIRDILLTIENNPLDANIELNTYYRYELLRSYSIDVIQDHAMILMENNYISGLMFETAHISEIIFVSDLEVSGHELLDFIRSEAVFNGTQFIIKTVGDVPLTAFQSLASFVAEGLLLNSKQEHGPAKVA